MGIYLILFILALSMLISRGIIYLNQLKKGGEVLLKIDNPYKLGITLSGILVVGLTLMLILGIIIRNMNINDILSNLFWLTLAYYFFLPQLIKKKVCEKGIVEFFGYLSWDNIKSYKWTKISYKRKDVERLEIILNDKKRKHKKIFMFIESQQKKEINEIFRKNI